VERGRGAFYNGYMSLFATREQMVDAFQRADSSFDGLFYTGVRTTGIFCIPSCSARKPLAANIEFFDSAREALKAGYRPCKRCSPMTAPGSDPEWLRPLLDEIEKDPKRRFRDEDLREMGMEPVRVRRYFHSKYGMTFQAYMRARRLGEAFTEIHDGASIDDAVFESGFESHSGFRSAFERVFGYTPGKAADASTVKISWVETPIGPMIAGATERGICILEYTDRRLLETQLGRVRKWCGDSVVPGENEHTREMRKQLADYFAGELREFTAPLDVRGTPFQEKVWAALRTIPYGETRSYGDLARQIGMPTGMRAVARANGDNRVAIVIPCHRVIGSDGDLTGYGGGLWRKHALLERERTPASDSVDLAHASRPAESADSQPRRSLRDAECSTSRESAASRANAEGATRERVAKALL
jgi:AraC family transcriptional regulator of adaptative response/methylated-DNA-[protein]-cysteine methyltransferase